MATATPPTTTWLTWPGAGAFARRLGLDTVYLVTGLPLGLLTFTVVVTGWSVSLGLAITLIGLPLALLTVALSRGLAMVERRPAALVLGGPIDARYRSWTDGSIWRRLRSVFADPTTWKDLAWHLLLLPVGLAGFTIAVTAWSTTAGLLLMYVVAEALTNAAKHASAASAAVRLSRAEDRLVVEVSDDGVGGADPSGGGLTGLRSRVAALDGTLRVPSPAGGPTLVRAELPCVP